VFGVFMRALIEELRVNLHEHLHGIVHHAVNSAVIQTTVRQVVERDENKSRVTYRFQWPFEFS
jgi:hypothetical protein